MDCMPNSNSLIDNEGTLRQSPSGRPNACSDAKGTHENQRIYDWRQAGIGNWTRFRFVILVSNHVEYGGEIRNLKKH